MAFRSSPSSIVICSQALTQNHDPPLQARDLSRVPECCHQKLLGHSRSHSSSPRPKPKFTSQSASTQVSSPLHGARRDKRHPTQWDIRAEPNLEDNSSSSSASTLQRRSVGSQVKRASCASIASGAPPVQAIAPTGLQASSTVSNLCPPHCFQTGHPKIQISCLLLSSLMFFNKQFLII